MKLVDSNKENWKEINKIVLIVNAVDFDYSEKLAINLNCNFENISKGAFKQSFGFLIVSILGPTLFIQLIAMLVIYKIYRMNKEFIFENVIFIWNKYLIKNFNRNSILLLEKF